jgi:hypothetical protein
VTNPIAFGAPDRISTLSRYLGRHFAQPTAAPGLITQTQIRFNQYEPGVVKTADPKGWRLKVIALS